MLPAACRGRSTGLIRSFAPACLCGPNRISTARAVLSAITNEHGQPHGKNRANVTWVTAAT